MSENEFVGFGVFGCDFMDMTELKRKVFDREIELKLKIKQLQNENDQLRLGNNAAWTEIRRQLAESQANFKDVCAQLNIVRGVYEECVHSFDIALEM